MASHGCHALSSRGGFTGNDVRMKRIYIGKDGHCGASQLVFAVIYWVVVVVVVSACIEEIHEDSSASSQRKPEEEPSEALVVVAMTIKKAKIGSKIAEANYL